MSKSGRVFLGAGLSFASGFLAVLSGSTITAFVLGWLACLCCVYLGVVAND